MGGHIWIGLAGGALAFAHCMGMCGGFAMHLSSGGRTAVVLGRQLAWHAGKTFTYVFLGALAGFGGSMLQSHAGILWVQKALTVAAGGVMVVMGIGVLGFLPHAAGRQSPLGDCRGQRTGRQDEGLWSALFRTFFSQPTLGGAFGLGVATGFLPCPVVMAFLAYAAQTGSTAAGMLTMAAVGAGTLWSLLLLGMTGRLIHARLRRWAAVVAGVVLILLGVATALRGTTAFHRILGCPAPPSGGACCATESRP